MNSRYRPAVPAKMRGRFASCIFVGVLSAFLVQAAPICAQENLPKGAEPLSAVELFAIYRDRTWLWNDGAGRFFDENRHFLGWVKNDQVETYGEGRYQLYNNGTMCIQAVWYARDSSTDARNCFLHYRDRGTVYQKREGSGDWYVFKHFRETGSDEFSKLVEEDDVTPKVAEMKLRFSKETEAKEGE